MAEHVMALPRPVGGDAVPVTPIRLPRLLRQTLSADRRLTGSRRWGRPGTLRRPLFLLGAPRSGTTFLGDALGAVPAFSYHHEPVATKAITGGLLEGTWPAGLAHGGFALTYTMLLASSHGAGRRFCEKTPQNCFIVPQLASWFADAQFLHIVRDGRDAALSYAQKPWLAAASAGSGRHEPGGYPWGPYARFWVEPERRAEFEHTSDLHRCIWAWRLHVEAALSGLALLPAERSLEIRYEQLVVDPAGHAARLTDFLGLDQTNGGALATALAAADPGSVGRWRRELSMVDAEHVAAEAGALLERLSYGD
jgi:LPS sulfotransferase NodH